MLKALGFGCAILALNTRFNQEMLQKGKFGWYFEKNAASVVAITDMAENSPENIENLRAHSREGLTNKYNWDVVTDEYETLFKALCKRKIKENLVEINY